MTSVRFVVAKVRSRLTMNCQWTEELVRLAQIKSVEKFDRLARELAG